MGAAPNGLVSTLFVKPSGIRRHRHLVILRFEFVHRRLGRFFPRPLVAQDFGLLHHQLECFRLLVGRIFVAPQNNADHISHFGAYALALLPIDAHIFSQLFRQLLRDLFKRLVSHLTQRRFVLRQSVVKSQLVG